MVVQGAEVRYRASLPDGSPLDAGSVEYSYAFLRRQGDVEFLTQDDDGDTATNRFRADGYGENLIEVTATDGNGSKATVLDTVLVHFSSSRALGGNAENLPDSMRTDMATDIDTRHDLTMDPPGMAYLPDNCRPTDCPRGDTTTREIQKGFYLTKAPRMMITSQGTLLAALVGIRVNGPGEGQHREVQSGSGIVTARSDDHGVTWKTQLVIQEDKEVWGFVGMVEVKNVAGDDGVARDTVYLYASGGHFQGSEAPGVSQKRRGTYYFTSTDDGRTWSSEPQRHDDIYKLTFTGSYLTPNSPSQDGNIPKGHQPATNLLHVPGLMLDGVEAPAGRGLLMHTYEEGYIFASINGGVNWSKVATYNGCANVNMMNEIAWAVLPNDNGDIYMMFRRNSQVGHNLEYVITKEVRTGNCGLTFRGKYNQALENIGARGAHHWMTVIPRGEHRDKLLFSTPGDPLRGKRHHARLWLSKAIRGSATVNSGMYRQARVKNEIAWHQSAVGYLRTGLPNTRDMGKDAIVLVSESEPIHRETYQFMDLQPDHRSKVLYEFTYGDERFTVTALVLSQDYLNTLLGAKALSTLSAASSASLSESGGPVEVTVTAQLSTAVVLGAPAFEAPLAISGTAWRGLDYGLEGTASVTIQPGQSTGVTVLTITPVDDADAEGMESLVIEAGGKTAELALFDDDWLGFEAGEGWAGHSTGVNAFAGPLTDIHDHVWKSSGDVLVKVLRSHGAYGARTGEQALALNWGGTAGQSSHVVLNPAGAGGVGELSFWIKGHAAGNSDFRFYVESSMDATNWHVAHQEVFQGNAPAAYARRAVSIRRPGDVLLRLRVEGAEGLVLDDLSLASWALVLISESTLTVDEDGGEKSYTVVLAKQPADDVVVKLASGDDLAARVSPPELTFTTSNWDTAQAVRVTGVNDNVDNTDDQRRTAITHTVTSTDADYAGAVVSEVAVVVADDDTATLVLSVNTTTLAEGASTADVTVTATLDGRGAGRRPGIAAGVARDSPGRGGLRGVRHGAGHHDCGGECGGGGESDDHSGG